MNDKYASGRPGIKGDSTISLYLACGSLMGMIFLWDLSIAPGVAMGVSYVVVVLISLWFPRKRITIIIGVACSVLIIAAAFCKPAALEMWKVVFNRSLALFAIWVTVLLGLQRKVTEEKREMALREREKTLEDMRVLRGLLPICASCKKIRDDHGYWTQIELYIRQHSEADFSHGICPDCAKKYYSEFYKEKKDDADPDA